MLDYILHLVAQTASVVLARQRRYKVYLNLNKVLIIANPPFSASKVSALIRIHEVARS